MKTCGCDLNVLYVEVWENYLIISRCSRFNSIPENHFKIPFDEVPNDKNKLVEFILKYSKKPLTFKDLSKDEKICEETCFNIFNNEINNVVINVFGCNLQCPMCFFTEHKVSSKMIKLYSDICDAFIKTDYSIAFTHRGEPFLFREVINNYYKNNRSFSCISNLTLIQESDFKLLAKNNCKITCSIDSIDETIYRAIRHPASHEDYLRALYNAKELAKLNVLTMNLITITDENLSLKDLLRTFKFFKDLNIPVQFGINCKSIKYDNPVVLRLRHLFPEGKYWRI